MSTELVYRMRTCAAALAGNGEPSPVLLRDACDLLVEASNVIDVPEPLGEPMQVIEPVKPAQANKATWGTDLPSVTPQPCPSCGDATSARTALRNGRRLMLLCPKCGTSWEYGKHGA